MLWWDTALASIDGEHRRRRVLTWSAGSGGLGLGFGDAGDGESAKTLGVRILPSGEVVFVDSSAEIIAGVETADISASNGLIHAIDTVLVPPENIVEVLQRYKKEDFGKLLSVLPQGVISLLSDYGPFTLFAPNDGAFDGVDVDALAANPELLAQILSYHVVTEAVKPSELAKRSSLVTLLGVPIDVAVDEGSGVVTLSSNDGTVSATVETRGDKNKAKSFRADNGIVYIIDKVLTPQVTTSTAVTTEFTPGKCTGESDTRELTKRGGNLQAEIDAAVVTVQQEQLLALGGNFARYVLCSRPRARAPLAGK